MDILNLLRIENIGIGTTNASQTRAGVQRPTPVGVCICSPSKGSSHCYIPNMNYYAPAGSGEFMVIGISARRSPSADGRIAPMELAQMQRKGHWLLSAAPSEVKQQITLQGLLQKPLYD